MYRGQEDLVWLVPLFLAAVFLLASAQMWWRVSSGNAGAQRLAAFSSSVSSLLLALSIFAAFWVRG